MDLQGFVDRAGRRRPGVVAGVLTPSGTLTAGTGGLDETTVLEIGSITKVFTALLLALAVERGEVSLETQLAEVLPEARVPTKDGEPIRLRHLATHTSGLPRLPMSTWRALASMRDPDPWAAITDADVLAAVDRARLKRAPGSGRLSYSNLGAGLLGTALVRAAGASDYETLLLERLCKPLGLHDTVVTLSPDQQARLATGHRGRRKPTPPWHLPALPGAGAARSTLADLLRFAAVAVDPRGTPLEAAMRLTQQPGPTKGIGLGWMLLTGRGHSSTVCWHNGGTGGFRSFLGVVPAEGSGVAVLTNCTRSVDLVGFKLLRQHAVAGEPPAQGTTAA